MNGVRRFIDAVTSPSSAEPSQPAVFKETPQSDARSSTSSNTSQRFPPTHLATRKSAVLDARDELLLSLLASQALVDSRGSQILSAEEVEDLKKVSVTTLVLSFYLISRQEQQVLTSRLEALTKKLALETKIRDAAVSLSKVNASNKVSKQTDEQLESANRRVELVQKDLWRISERNSEVQKKLLEHRAGVLSYSVRSMEKKISPSNAYDSGYDSTSMSPSSSSISAAVKPRFDGAHLFAGHADAVVPKRRKSPQDFLSLEEKLKEATQALTSAGKKQAEMARDLQLLRLEKQKVETMMGMDLQNAQETIVALEKEVPKLEEMDAEHKALIEEKTAWEEERAELLKRAEDGLDKADVQKQVEAMSREWEQERQAWEQERSDFQDEKMEDLARLQEEMETIREDDRLTIQNLTEELEAALSVAQRLVQAHGISGFSRDSSVKGLLASIGQHMNALKTKLDVHANVEAEWESSRRQLEEEIASLKVSSSCVGILIDTVQEASNIRPPSLGLDPDSRIAAVLQPIWASLPSPETRAAKFAGQNQSRFRTGSPTPSSPGGLNTPTTPTVKSLSELDVRSLKTLYDSRASHPPSPNNSSFTIEAFAARVQALIQDDRALIERLIRFAQAHELLKKNAERAQKLAQESNSALETYQKQVRTLEERNLAIASKQAAM